MRRFSVLGAGSCWALLAACGDTSSPEPTTDLVIDGDWYWEESVEDPKLGIQCFDSGRLTVSQNGARFQATGHITGACSGPGGTVGIDDPIQVVSGVLSGSTISFSVDGCPYRGTAHGTAPAPDSATGTVTCTITQSGVTAHLSGTWRLLQSPPDNQSPMVSGALSGSSAPPAYAGSIMLRDSLRIMIQSSDDRGLTWVGFTLGGSATAQDSAAVTGGISNQTFTRAITPSMVGPLTVTAFARDSAGNRTVVPLGTLTVLNIAAAITDSATLPGAVVDLAYDAKRDRIYLSTFGSSEVLVLDRATGAPAMSPYVLPGQAGGLDLSVSGDSLLVALSDRSAIAVVNLVNSQVDTTHLDFDQSLPRVASWLRVAANGQALVVGTVPGYSGFGAQLATVNLATAVGAIRTDVGMGGAIGFFTRLARTGDRTRVAVIDVGASPGSSYLYGAAANAFSGPFGVGLLWAPFMQGSETGGRFMYAQTVLNQDLAVMGSYTDPSSAAGDPTAISADGSRVFLGGAPQSLPGFVVQSVVSHTVLDRLYVPGWTPNVIGDRRFTALADGNTLLVHQGSWGALPGATKLHIVHLN